MKACPTSGPSTMRSTSQARELASSRRSLSNKRRHDVASGERKKNLFDVGVRQLGATAQLVQCAFADDESLAEQHETIANAHRIVELMDREQKRASLGRNSTEQRT